MQRPQELSGTELLNSLGTLGVECGADPATVARYSADASLYRIPPLAVAYPRHRDEVQAVLSLCSELGVPLTARGAGTSVAGNAVGPGLVLDLSRHLNRVLEVDPDRRTALVETGLVHAALQAEAAKAGLRFGPDPSTQNRCTIGGMIGNNACGARSLGYGRTTDNVNGLRGFLADGAEIATGALDQTIGSSHALSQRLSQVVLRDLATIRLEFDRFDRQVSGYALHHLLPERWDLTQALIGSEGTLAVLTEALVNLVEEPRWRTMVVLGFESIAAAGHAAPLVVAHGPTACEGLDRRIVDVLRRHRGQAAVPPLPRGDAWLLVEFAGAIEGEVHRQARELDAAGYGVDSAVVQDPRAASRLWGIREDGAGLGGTAPSGRPAWSGWEDVAVPPMQLGTYLEQFDELLDVHGLTCAPFGHFGEGCVHVRLDFDFAAADGTRRFRNFLTEAADLVVALGGTLSGEHGDGRARSELLPRMYTAQAIRMFAEVKDVFDPARLLNPGVIVAGDPVDAHVRPALTMLGEPQRTAFAFSADEGSMARAVQRCTGVGKCRAVDTSARGAVMCPSFVATRDEKDSTRGRARVLQEVMVGGVLDVHSPEVHEALDLCLACKGCTAECPTGVDMPTLKAEVLHQAYRRRVRPVAHYSLGWLPRWARLAGVAPALINLLFDFRSIRQPLLRLAGVDPRRRIPRLATRSLRAHWRARTRFEKTSPRRLSVSGTAGDRGPVLLFADTFSSSFEPELVIATAKVLSAVGFEPQLPRRQTCCGLTWISTGQLDAARSQLRRTLEELDQAARQGIPIVGVEPSCTAVLRSEARELVGGQIADRVAENTFTLAELLQRFASDWDPPSLADVRVVAQPHCHHRAVLGWAADEQLLKTAGADVTVVAGCCGLAGNFGVEAGHYDISVAVAEQNLLPALDGQPEAVVLADGFSCRTQVVDLRGRPAMHLAKLLAARLTRTD